MCAALVAANESANAQGITHAGVRGLVTIDSTAVGAVGQARARITHEATGFAVDIDVNRGRFFAQGLEPGGPYTILVRRPGFAPHRRDSIYLGLGEMRELHFTLVPLAIRIDSIEIATDSRAMPSTQAGGGTATSIGESLLRTLPTLNRDLYDFVRLVPGVSTRIGIAGSGFSAGGVGFRFNNFLINGVSERTISGSVSGAFGGAKSVPLDAVREYQVLLAPYDVRYGDFAGGLVNAITKSGSNTFTGSAFGYVRNDRLARRIQSTGATPYDRAQYGLTLGGPIIRDRVHFFIAPELQHFSYPAAGPYLGQPAGAPRDVPVHASDLARLTSIMRAYGLEAGSAGAVENGNPLRNVFARVDANAPSMNSRMSLWTNYGSGEEFVLSRASLDTFSLSSNQVSRVPRTIVSALQLHTTLPRRNGGHNELLVSTRSESLRSIGNVDQPLIRVSLPSASTGRITVVTGSQETAHGQTVQSSSTTIRDNLTLPLGASHVLTVGVEAERFRTQRQGVSGAFGAWTFASLDDLEAGEADRYEVGLDLGSGSATLDGTQYAAYVGDHWKASSRLSITAGLRADLLALDGRAPYHTGVDSIFARRTDQQPRRRIEWSPRIGFTWDARANQRHVVRGGTGLFTTRYPLAWAHTARTSFGTGSGVLRCGRGASDAGLPPSFNPDYTRAPAACANNESITASRRGDVDLLDGDLRMMRTARGSLAYDFAPGDGFRITTEALVTRSLSDFAFVNLNLMEPISSDRNGRVMYGDIGISGVPSPRLKSGFSEVIDLRNTSQNRSYQLVSRIERSIGRRATGIMSYTFSRTKDAQTPLRVNARGLVSWASARAYSGRDDDLSASISSNDIPHRVVVAGTWNMPRPRWSTALSFYYVGESGRPFTYVAFGAQRRGDLNADGANTNDPIYVPRDASDPNEIRYADPDDNRQAVALESFIERTPCLRRQRGRVLERNSCREPWSNTTIASLRQTIPLGTRAIETQLDVFNVLNLLNGSWGIRREALPGLLEHVAQTSAPVETSQALFRFDPDASRLAVNPSESAFQLQVALRYRF